MGQLSDPGNGSIHHINPGDGPGVGQPTGPGLPPPESTPEATSTGSKVMKIFLRPAVWLMNRLRFPQKFFLISLLVAVPLSWILFQYVSIANHDINLAIREQRGIEYLSPVARLLQHTQQHMALNDALLQGNTIFESGVNSIREEIDRDIAVIDQTDARYGAELSMTASWQDLKGELNALKADMPSLDQQQSFARHAELLEHIEDFMVIVGNNSRLVLDPDIDTYYLMDTLVLQIPRATSYYSRVRVYGLHLQTGEELSPVDETSLVVYGQLARSIVVTNQRGLQYAFEANPQVEAALDEQVTRSLSALNDLDEALSDRSLGTTNSGELPDVTILSAEMYRVATLAIDERFELYQQVSSTLNRLLLARIELLTRSRNIAFGGALIVIVVMAYLFWGLYWSVRDVIFSLAAYSRQGPGYGKTAADLVADNHDELAQGVRAMAARLDVAFYNLAESIREAQQATRVAHEANRLKSEFLATVSHELRTPLNAMIGFSEIMLAGMGGELDEDARGMTERIHANSQRLLSLINDILDLSRIEARRVDVVERAFSPHEVITDLCESMQSLADKNKLAFEYTVDPALPPELIGDPAVIERILTNLLSNAFKFTNAGKVRLIALRSRKAAEWTVTVSDTGIGIPPHAREYIFDPFRQVDGSPTRAYGGTGLGLAIVKELVRTIGGTINLESAVGMGSTFVVALPLITPQTEPGQEVSV